MDTNSAMNFSQLLYRLLFLLAISWPGLCAPVDGEHDPEASVQQNLDSTINEKNIVDDLREWLQTRHCGVPVSNISNLIQPVIKLQNDSETHTKLCNVSPPDVASGAKGFTHKQQIALACSSISNLAKALCVLPKPLYGDSYMRASGDDEAQTMCSQLRPLLLEANQTVTAEALTEDRCNTFCFKEVGETSPPRINIMCHVLRVGLTVLHGMKADVLFHTSDKSPSQHVKESKHGDSEGANQPASTVVKTASQSASTVVESKQTTSTADGNPVPPDPAVHRESNEGDTERPPVTPTVASHSLTPAVTTTAVKTTAAATTTTTTTTTTITTTTTTTTAIPAIPPSSNEYQESKNEEVSSGRHGQEPRVHVVGFQQSAESHFFAYFLTTIVLCIVFYLLFHNKQKIVALILEGRNTRGSRRRPNSAAYRKLDTNLEEALTSTSSRRNSHTNVIY